MRASSACTHFPPPRDTFGHYEQETSKNLSSGPVRGAGEPLRLVWRGAHNPATEGRHCCVQERGCCQTSSWGGEGYRIAFGAVTFNCNGDLRLPGEPNEPLGLPSFERRSEASPWSSCVVWSQYREPLGCFGYQLLPFTTRMSLCSFFPFGLIASRTRLVTLQLVH